MFDRQEPFIWNVEGGVCHFQGSCAINPGSSITLRKGAYLLFGDRVSMGQHTKIICHKKNCYWTSISHILELYLNGFGCPSFL